MTRQIRLTQIHALNWYGYCDSLPVAGNLLLAGITGSGKSVLMDLIQLVLLGSRQARYNMAATGATSARTLKGYCLGDTKEEEAGTPQYMRPHGAITYAALEFTWPDKKQIETWGLRIEFASAGENSPRHLTPFFLKGSLRRAEFLDDERKPLSLGAFEALVADRGGRCFRTLDDYRRDMAVPIHLNFDRPVMDRLLPMAMSFTFRSRFNDFCREHILPSEAIDISQVTTSYRTYRQYQHELTSLRDQLRRLENIHALFDKHQDAERETIVTQYLEQDYRLQHAGELRDQKAGQLERLRVEQNQQQETLRALSERITNLDASEKEKRSLFGEKEGGSLYLRIRGETQELTRRIDELKARGNTAGEALDARVRHGRAWLDDLRRLDLDLDQQVIHALDQAIRRLESGGLSQAEENLRQLTESAAFADNELVRASRPCLTRLQEIRRQRAALKIEIDRLKHGRLPFPTKVLDALNEELLWKSADPPAKHLRALCEVTDESWRPALEIAFARKFAIVVEESDYETSERIFHEMKASELGEDAGRESLIHPVKALNLAHRVLPGSLAEKLRSEHPVVEAVIAHLFGELICVEQRADFRRHDQAILPDGFASHGAFVERDRFYDGNPFLGANGLQQQLAWKQQQDARLADEEIREAPLERAVRDLQDRQARTFRPGDTLHRDLQEVRELPQLEARLKKNVDDLSKLDRQAFEELINELADIEQQLKTAREQEKHLLGSGKTKEVERAERDLETLRKTCSTHEDNFARFKLRVDISAHLPRLNELRLELNETLPGKDAAADECARRFTTADKQKAALWPQVVAEREKLAMEHKRYEELDAGSHHNTEYDKHLQRIAGADIVDYTDKAQREQRVWGELFQSHVLEKMQAALNEVKNLINLLNSFLKRPIGTSRYKIIHWDNKDFNLHHRMLTASGLAKEGELFFSSADADLRDTAQKFLLLLTEEPDSKEAQRLLDYRNYFEYDMEIHNTSDPGRPPIRVDRQSGKGSGGEHQSEYFIAILASYLRAYRRHEVRRKDPTLSLVPIDEAFSKLSGERIRDCVGALQALDLQGVFSMSTGNIPHAYDFCDQLIVVTKHEQRHGRQLRIRNEPVILRRGTPEERDWLAMLGEEATSA